MKIFCLTTLLCCTVILTGGCAGGSRACASDIVYCALTDCPALAGSFTVYFPDACEGEAGYMDIADFYDLYYPDGGDCGESALLDDWCVAICGSPGVRELHVLRVRAKSDRPVVRDMLERRAEMLRSPELYQSKSGFLGERAADVRVFTSGYFVILCAADDCADIVKKLS